MFYLESPRSPNVNVASQLEEASEQLGLWILLSNYMVKLCRLAVTKHKIELIAARQPRDAVLLPHGGQCDAGRLQEDVTALHLGPRSHEGQCEAEASGHQEKGAAQKDGLS